MISSRLPADLSPNAVTRAIAARLAARQPLIDLTESNPTRVGIPYPVDLLAPLADPAALAYDPQPLGLMSAREAVAGEYARHGLSVDAHRVALTSSTSEAYALLFKLFCDPGDEVLVPQPSYPLFDHLTRLEAVRTLPYELEYHGSLARRPRFRDARHLAAHQGPARGVAEQPDGIVPARGRPRRAGRRLRRPRPGPDRRRSVLRLPARPGPVGRARC